MQTNVNVTTVNIESARTRLQAKLLQVLENRKTAGEPINVEPVVRELPEADETLSRMDAEPEPVKVEQPRSLFIKGDKQ